MILDPIIAPIVIQAAITAPLPLEEAEEIMEKAILKEINASQDWVVANFNYTPWLYHANFERQSKRTRLHPDLLPFPQTSRLISLRFSEFRSRIWGKKLFPNIGLKTLGEMSVGIARGFSQFHRPSEPSITYPIFPEYVYDLERLYHHTGTIFEGPVELRMAWKYNDVKPRVYYAQGPSVYFRTRYIQQIFNRMLDHFPVVHRYQRFYLPALARMLPDGVSPVIYDYSSFTSRCTESNDFILKLCDYFKGVPIFIVDTHYGIVQHDLGDLFLDLWEASKNQPYDVTELSGRLPDVTLGLVYHLTGMLGAPGNISLCTLFHGLLLASIIDDLFACKCVGDDAFVLLGFDDRQSQAFLNFIWGINLIGSVELDKTASWLPDDIGDSLSWKYLKRPIFRGENGVEQGLHIIPPMLEMLLPASCPIRRPSKCMNSMVTRAATFLKQLHRYIDSLHLHRGRVTEYGISVAEEYVRIGLRYLGLTARGKDESWDGIRREWEKCGGLPITKQLDGTSLIHARHKDTFLGFFHLPDAPVRRMILDELEEVQERLELPFYSELGVEFADLELDYYPEVSKVYACPELRLLQRLGYVEMEEIKETEVVDPTSALGQELIREFGRRFRAKQKKKLYICRVLEYPLPEIYWQMKASSTVELDYDSDNSDTDSE